jgi:two-component system NtrC family sensor kinase
MRILRRLTIALGIAMLIALLAYFYVKTQAISLEQQNRITLYLRELKELDAQWNVDILRSRMGINKNYDSITDPLVRLRAVEDVLELEAASFPGAVPAENIKKLRSTFEQKIELVDQFKSENAILRNSLRYLPTGAEHLKETIQELPKTDSHANENLALLQAQTSDVLTEILKFNLLPDSSTGERAKNYIHAIEVNRSSYPFMLDQELATLMNHARSVLHQRAVEDTLLRNIAAVPTGEKIDEVTNAFNQEFQGALIEKQRYRTYLFAYSALLLVLLAYAGWRLRKSYRVIADINKDLQIANQTLEQRVQDRTAELESALNHLKESEAQLIQSEKMASLGQMVAGVAHEINTPLAYVRSSLETVDGHLSSLVANLFTECDGLLELIKAGDSTDEAIHAQFLKAYELKREFSENEVMKELTGLLKDGIYGADQISELVATLKDFTRLDRQKVAEFDLHEGLKNTLLIAKNLVKNKTVKTFFRDIPRVTCSPSQINQVFLNLISNAAHATPDEGGVIYLVTGRHESDQVKIEVIDNGCGIPEDVLPKVLDPFFTTKAAGQGTGLGLSIVNKIIQEHGGTIKIDSKVGKGTKVTVLLPINQHERLAEAA